MASAGLATISAVLEIPGLRILGELADLYRLSK